MGRKSGRYPPPPLHLSTGHAREVLSDTSVDGGTLLRRELATNRLVDQPAIHRLRAWRGTSSTPTATAEIIHDLPETVPSVALSDPIV